jgi:TolB-like protein
MAFPLPDRPSIAVLPFANLSDDPAQAYFASGITDDLITDLSQIPGLFVIARSSTFIYQGQDVPIRQVAEDLGVRYVLEGSVRRAGDEVRINAQLIDATSGGHLWAGRYDGTMTDVLAFQDQVTRQVASELEVTLTKAHAAHNDRQETDSPGAYDAVLRALEHARSYTKEDFAIAIPYLEKAIRLDPDYARAHTYLGGILWNIANEGWVRNFGLTYEEALGRPLPRRRSWWP